MKNMTLKNLADVCQGRLVGGEGLNDFEISSVTIDSRTVSQGCLFAAIAGERTDGHKYIPNAFAGGAGCVLAEHLPDLCPGPAVLVESVPKALQKAAAFYRSQFDIPFIGITGSVGKTTAKEMISSVLTEKYKVHKTAGNFNNELGVPLTLFGLKEEHTAAVIEMGISDFGEMRRLTEMVSPDYALFTIIGYSHLEHLGNRQGVLRAKSEMLEGMPEGGTVFVNGDDDLLCTLDCRRRLVTFGLGESCCVRAENIHTLENGHTACDILSGDRRIFAEIPAYGDHMVYAALEGAAVGIVLGLTDAEIARGIGGYMSVGHRGRIVEAGGITVIDDCYNANPTSVASAIRSMTKLGGRKVCILGDMLELGDVSEQLHREIGGLAVQCGAELLLTCGDMARFISEGAGEISVHFDNREQLISHLPEYVHAGDTVLVKASHSMRFEEICKAIEEL